MKPQEPIPQRNKKLTGQRAPGEEELVTYIIEEKHKKVNMMLC